MSYDRIEYIVEWTIKDGQSDKFKELASACAKAVQENEPGMLSYQWHYDDSGMKCYLAEHHTDSASMVAHLTSDHLGEYLPKLLEVSDITRFEVLGNLTDEGRKILEPFGTSQYPQELGFTR